MSDDDGGGLPDTCGILAVVSGTVALILSLVGNFFCGYTNRTVTATNVGGITTEFVFRAGIWNFEDYSVWLSSDGSALYYTTYAYCVPWRRDAMNMDAMWKTAMSFSIISVIVGGIASIASCFIVCVGDPTGGTNVMGMKVVALCFLFTTLFQGLTFLYFKSNGCTNGSGTTERSGQELSLSWDSCSLSSAANTSIASVCLWFIATIMLLFSARSMRK